VIDFRILGMVGFYLAVAGMGVTTVLLAARPAVWEEHIPHLAMPSAERVSDGLQVSVRGRFVEVRVPGCETSSYPDGFFIHVFPRRDVVDQSGDYVNIGFLLADETPERSRRDGAELCSYRKSFAQVDAEEVIVGQYRLQSDGTCCQILWSRSYFPSGQ
jgi:hypothetical protein